MRLTLLEIVQDILSEMDSFEVNSITDTTESAQVAAIVRATWYDIISQKNWPFLRRTVQLDSANATRPTHLKLPTTVKELTLLKYNKRTVDDTRDKYADVQFVYPDEFLAITNGRVSSDTNVDTITDIGGIDIQIFNDRAPEYWTSFDDEYIVCDAYDSDVDSYLQNSKTQAIAFIEPSWTHSDGAYPELPNEMFSQLVNEAKSRAFYVLKQMPNEKAEQESVRHRRRNSRKAWQANGGVRYPDYGRRTKK